MRSRTAVFAALPAVLLMSSAHAHADDRKNTADIPARHYDIVSRVESLDGAERTVDQDKRVTYGLQSKVLFAKDSAQLSEQAQSRLGDIASKIATSGTAQPVLVNGYTDDLGSAEHGLTLSRKRAEAVLQVLAKDPRLATIRFKAAGYGEKQPIADNKDESGRVKNRRVEIVVTRS
ncbi:OmpA family protein [Streptomyces sp. NBC_01433]|uniref:OmpA family protein n=1 Tax=Streptomyces sp. NBC_01433 TaxID=2903864 RepID=UPI00224FBC14|nr:OmpA family protein [Streptomyces sp. NBC_01433]MCX4682116.1 OmpA family protein [Streptomyces sp. NBC_01433]